MRTELIIAVALAFLCSTDASPDVDSWQSARAEELTGDWVSDCTRLPTRHSVLATLSFSETAVTAVVEMFSDNGCQSLNLRGEYDALISVGKRTAAGREIDFTPTRVTMTIVKPEVAAAYNRGEGGGIDAWRIGEPRDVSGMSLDPYQMPTVGTAIYDVYDAGSGELRFGGFPEQIAATRPEDRPVSLGGMFRFVRTPARFATTSASASRTGSTSIGSTSGSATRGTWSSATRATRGGLGAWTGALTARREPPDPE